MGTRRSKYYASDSARAPLKECFAENPPIQLDPHQQVTGMSADQLIKFARAVVLEASLATFAMLEDVLMKIGGKVGKSGGDRIGGRPLFFSWAGPTVVESISPRSF